MLQEGPELLQDANSIEQRGQKVMYSLGKVEKGPPLIHLSPIHHLSIPFHQNLLNISTLSNL